MLEDAERRILIELAKKIVLQHRYIGHEYDLSTTFMCKMCGAKKTIKGRYLDWSEIDEHNDGCAADLAKIILKDFSEY
jgi:hypothetical protein